MRILNTLKLLSNFLQNEVVRDFSNVQIRQSTKKEEEEKRKWKRRRREEKEEVERGEEEEEEGGRKFLILKSVVVSRSYLFQIRNAFNNQSSNLFHV